MDRLPISIMIEPTDNCNLSCWMCPRSQREDVHHTGVKPSRRYMSAELFEQLTSQLCSLNRLRIDTLFFHWIGEPFLHPEYLEMLICLGEARRCGKLEFRAIETHTNGHLLDSRMAHAIIEKCDDRFPWVLSVSLDAFSERNYQSIRKGKELRRVYSNLSRLLKLREEKKLKWPRLILQFIVQEKNDQEAERFYRYWDTFFKARGLPLDVQYEFNHAVETDRIFFRTLDQGTPKEQQLHVERVHRLKKRLGHAVLEKPSGEGHEENAPGKNRLCVCMWQSCAVRWDGNVNFICDIENEMPLGNLAKAPFEDIFLGKIANEYRKLQLEGKAGNIEKCRLCGAYLSPNSGMVDAPPELLYDLIAGKSIGS
jgi:molybdenum cofactor biosynthesis enzyme MoaA